MDIQSIDVWDEKTWPRLKHMIQYYNDLIFDNHDDSMVPFWNAEVSYLRSMLEQGHDKYIPF